MESGGEDEAARPEAKGLPGPGRGRWPAPLDDVTA